MVCVAMVWFKSKELGEDIRRQQWQRDEGAAREDEILERLQVNAMRIRSLIEDIVRRSRPEGNNYGVGNPAVGLRMTETRPEPAGSHRPVEQRRGREQDGKEEEILGERQRDQLREQRVAWQLGDVATASLKEEKDVERDQT